MLQKPIQDCTKNQRFLTSTTSDSYLRADLLASFGSSHECCVCVSTDTDLQFFLQGTPGYCYDIPRGFPDCPGCDGPSSAYCIHDIGKVSSMNQKYHHLHKMSSLAAPTRSCHFVRFNIWRCNQCKTFHWNDDITVSIVAFQGKQSLWVWVWGGSDDGAVAIWNVPPNHLDTFRPIHNDRHFPYDIFKCIFVNENVCIFINMSMKFVPKGPINNIPALVQRMALRQSGDRPLSQPMMVSLLTHICVTRPRWVKRKSKLKFKNDSIMQNGWFRRINFRRIEFQMSFGRILSIAICKRPLVSHMWTTLAKYNSEKRKVFL